MIKIEESDITCCRRVFSNHDVYNIIGSGRVITTEVWDKVDFECRERIRDQVWQQVMTNTYFYHHVMTNTYYYHHVTELIV